MLSVSRGNVTDIYVVSKAIVVDVACGKVKAMLSVSRGKVTDM